MSLWLIPLFIGLAGVVYWPSLHGEFIWDDVDIYIVENPILKDPNGLFRFWFTNDPIDYYPLTYSSFWVEWRLVGGRPELYHINNWLLHAMSSFAIYWIARELRFSASLWLALLFLLHPMQVESVAWICQRKTILSCGLGFASVGLYLRSLRIERSHIYWAALSVFCLSLSAKPTLITLPIVLVGYLVVSKRLDGKSILRHATPFVIASIVFGIIGTAFQQKLIDAEDVRGQDLLTRICSVGWVIWFYIIQFPLVWSNCFVYPRWEIDAHQWISWVPLVGAMYPVAWACRSWWTNHLTVNDWKFCWCVYLVSVLPVSGIADIYYWRYSYVGDHYIYQSLPLIIGLYAQPLIFLKRHAEQGSLSNRVHQVQRFGLIAALFVLASCTYMRAMVYQSPLTLWRDTVSQNPRAALAWSQLGSILRDNACFAKAIEIDPKLWKVWLNLGNMARERLDWHSAKQSFERAAECAIGDARLTAQVGALGAIVCMGNAGDGIDAARELLRDPKLLASRSTELAKVHIYLSRALSLAGHQDQSQSQLAQVNSIVSEKSVDWDEVAYAYEDIGEFPLAMECLKRFILMNPEDPKSIGALGRIAISSGDFRVAVNYLARASQLAPMDADIRSNHGISLASIGEHSAALREFQSAVRAAPTELRYQKNLARLLMITNEFREAERVLESIIKADENDASAWQSLAWLQATAPPGSLSKSSITASIENARRACGLYENREVSSLVTLSAALAANGDFDTAVDTIRMAIQIAGENSSESIPRSSLEAHLERFLNHKSLQIVR